MDGMSISERGTSLVVANQAVQAVRGSAQSDRVPAGGWLRAVRVASGASQSELAAKLGFKRQAWAQFEASEARGAISLASLRRAADALGCDFSYHVVPREGTGGELKRGRPPLWPAPLQPPVAGADEVSLPSPTEPSIGAKPTAGPAPVPTEWELPMELR